MANTLEYAQIFQSALDQQFIEIATSSWMEANSANVRYTGGNTVKIPKVSVEGLGAYSRTGGFPDGAATIAWETRTLSQDRGKEFNLDAMDYDETNFVAGAGTIMGEFQRTQVVPEVDAYRYSKIFSVLNPVLKTAPYVLDKSTIYAQLKSDIKDIQNVVGENEPLVIAISYEASNILDESTEIQKHINWDNFSNGTVDTKVRTLDNIPMFRIPGARFKTSYVFSATNGFSAGPQAMAINWIIAARSAIIAIVKTDKVRIFAPDSNQAQDAWKIQYRKFHDLWILDNKYDGCKVSYTPIAAPALSVTFIKPTTLGKTKWTATPGSGNTLAYKMQATAGDDKYNDIPAGVTAYISGSEIDATAGQHCLCFELDATGHIVKYADHTLVSGDIGTGA